MQQLDLRKQIVLDLKKSNGLEHQTAAVCAVYDKSGSMEDLYRNGFMQTLTERVLPLGMAFDDNESVDLYVFHNEAYIHPKSITVRNITEIVPEIIKTYTYGGTQYAPVIKLIMDEWIGKPAGGGLFGFGKSKRPTKVLDYPVYVLYFTDGENSDPTETDAMIKECSQYGIFFQFIGIGNASFSYLKKLDTMNGRVIDNANFFQANDIRKIDDNELYNRLLAEFPSFVKEARAQGMIR